MPSSAALALLCLLDATAVPSPAPRRGVLPAAAAVVPGLLLHGSGHFVAGDRRTAGRLLAVESAGVAALLGGLGGLAATGAARRFVAPLILTTVAGAGLFVGSALADLYGVLAPAGGAGAALPFSPVLDVAAGGLYVYNPTFAYRWLGGVAADLRGRALSASPSVYVSGDGQTLRAAVRAAYRLRGPRPDGSPAASGTVVDVGAGITHHRERRGPAPWHTTMGEASVAGRLDLGGWAPSLAGSFFDWSGGVGVGGTRFGGSVDTTESTSVLLARFGYGVWLGRGTAPRAEIVLAYDHGHDGFTGGLKLPGLSGGASGHVALDASVYLTARWGLRALAEAGSAYVLGVSVVYRRWKVAP